MACGGRLMSRMTADAEQAKSAFMKSWKLRRRGMTGDIVYRTGGPED